jgi:hypothetical protein
MKRASFFAAVVVAMIAAALPAQADTLSATSATISGATFATSTPPASAPVGVSPEIFYKPDTKTYYLLTTANPPVQYTSTDGVTWKPTSVALPNGFDWSIVEVAPSSYRLYFAEVVVGPGQGPPKPCEPGTKRLRYATSTDLQSWAVQPQVLLNDVGCGVPHVMKTKDGRYFLYFNKRDPVHGIYVGTSADGLSWSVGNSLVGNDSQLVDPAPLEMPDGSFLMVGSTTGDPRTGALQELQLLSSTDAVTWTKRPTALYSVKGASVLDPSVELIDGRIRVWFGYAPGGDHNASRIADGVLSLGAGAAAGAKAGKAGKAGAAAKAGKSKAGKAGKQ